MKKVFLFLILICLSNGFFAGCASKAEAIPKNSSIFNNKFDDACQEWQQIYDSLRDKQKEELSDGDITFVNSQGYFLSEQLVNDCRLRLKIPEFIGKIILGTTNDVDEEFARKNSKEIMRVAKSTWNYYSDGASSEKYLLLINEGINDEDVASFIAELLKQEESFSPEDSEDELFYTLFVRPLPSVNSVILQELPKFEEKKDISNQVYALIILQKTSPDYKYISKLKKIGLNKNLSSKVKVQLDKITGKLEHGDKLEYEDVETFGIFYAQNSPVSTEITNK